MIHRVISRILAGLLLLGAGVAAAQPDGGATHVLTRLPALKHFVPAPYPKAAQAKHLQAQVLLQIDIDAQGKVSAARVLKPAGHGFDQAALGAVKQFTFTPAEIDGKPAPVRITYRYRFVLAPAPKPKRATPQPITFSGRALERGTRNPLPYADVVARPVSGGKPVAVKTDAQGRFHFLGLPPGRYQVTVLAPDHLRFRTKERVVPHQRTEATYYVRRATYSEYQTVVTGQRERKEVAHTTLTQEEIRLVPGTQGDALKVVENLPGVARAPYGIGLLVVRGSKPWDTRVYIDDAVVPQLFHFGGLTSVYNSSLLKSITFSPGNFNVDRGRAIGGLVTATSREPNPKAFHGYLDANVIDASALLEGPISPTWSFAVAVRRSYIDAVLGLVLPKSWGLDFTLAPRYYDYQALLDWHPRDTRNHLRLTLFGSDDRLALLLQNPAAIDPEARASLSSHVGFHLLSAIWRHRYSEALRQRLSVQTGLNLFDNAFGQDISGSTVSDITTAREVLDWDLTPKLTLEGGADLFFAPYRYSAQVPQFYQVDQLPDPIASRQLVKASASGAITEPALYVQAFWKPLPRMRIIPGLRADYDATLHRGWLDPRLAASWGITPRTTLKAALGLYHQPPDYRLGLVTAKLGNPHLGPEGAEQYMLGAERKLAPGLTLEVQAYFKWLFHQVQTTDAEVVRNGQKVPERYDNGGLGRSYGVELLFRQALTSHLFGWIAYSLEKTELCSARFSLSGKRPDCPTFGSANWTTFPLDQPNHLIAVISYKLPKGFIVGARAQYATGNPITPVLTSVYDADGDIYLPVPGRYFSQRVPAFFQLDLRIDKRFVFQKWMLTTYLDVQNVTNRHNPEYVLYNYDYAKRAYLSGLPILPSLGVKGEF